MPQYFQLHSFRIRTLGDHSRIKQVLRRSLQFKGAQYEGEHAPPEGFHITLDFSADREPASPPEDARYIDITGHPGTGIWRMPGRMILCRENTTVDLHPEIGVAKAAIPPDLFTPHTDQRPSSLLSYLAAISLAILLRAYGWFPLHAAGLTREGRGVLLTARSGSGKSTAALSLVRDGWGYLSDDTVLLRSENDQIKSYSFRRNFCVDTNAAAHFPELDGSEWAPALSDSTKWEIDPSEIYPGRSVAACTPRLVVLPCLADASESWVEQIGTKPALEQLLNQGGFFLTPGSDAAERHLTVLRRLIDQVHTYRFHAGRDVLEEPRTVHTLLAPLLKDAPTAEA